MVTSTSKPGLLEAAGFHENIATCKNPMEVSKNVEISTSAGQTYLQRGQVHGSA